MPAGSWACSNLTKERDVRRSLARCRDAERHERYAVEDTTAAAALRAVEANGELFRQCKGFAGPVEVPATAPPLNRVLALSGRDPAWTAKPWAAYPAGCQ